MGEGNTATHLSSSTNKWPMARLVICQGWGGDKKNGGRPSVNEPPSTQQHRHTFQELRALVYDRSHHHFYGRSCFPFHFMPTSQLRPFVKFWNHGDCAAIFIGKLDDYEHQKEGIPETVKKISFDFYGVQEGELVSNWLTNQKPLEAMPDWKADELMTIMYTSGTTGKPKGVMFNSAASRTAMAIIDYLDRVKPMPPHPDLFSYLPLCHIAERALTEILGCRTGAEFHLLNLLKLFLATLGQRSTTFILWCASHLGTLSGKDFRKLPQKKLDLLLKIPVVSFLIKKMLTKKLGLSRTPLLKATAAAPIPKTLLEWYEKLE